MTEQMANTGGTCCSSAAKHGTAQQQIPLLLHETATLIVQAQRLVCQARKTIWYNPGLSAVMLDDTGCLQDETVARLRLLAALLMRGPGSEPAGQRDPAAHRV